MARFLGLRGARLTSAISAVCGLCFLCYGYAQGVMGGLLTVPAFVSQFPQVNTLGSMSSHTAWITGLTVGAWNLGCIISSILSIFLSDLLGRRRTLLIGITIWTIGEIIQTTAYSFPQFVVGRAVAGFGNGFTTATVPAYQAECVKSHRKGTILMVSTGAFIAFGYALSYWLVFGFAYAGNSSATWRAPIALQIVFALPVIVLMFFLPESPRWLILTGREQEALTVLAALNDTEPDSYEIRDEFLQIKDAILTMASGSTSSMFSNRDRRGFHRVVLAYFVQVFAQGTGINLVLQYLSWILLNRMGYAGWLSRLLASCSATTYFIASFVAVVGIDRFWGRRSLMMFGASGMSGCMILITITQYLWTEKNINAGRIVSTIFLFLFSVFFAIGWQGMAWLYQVEIVPLRIRGPANALSTKVNWVVNSIIVIVTPIAFHNIGYRTWIIFACTNFAIIPLVYFFYPETAFRSLEEVDVIFYLADEAPGNAWLNAVQISLHEPLWFGKRGEKRQGFDYENSSWHRRLMDVTGSSGNGSGSGSNNEKKMREKNGNGSSGTDSGRKEVRSSGSDTVVPDTATEKRAASESPIDPRMWTAGKSADTSPQGTLTTTITSPKKDARDSLRRKIGRSLSREKTPQASQAFNVHQEVIANADSGSSRTSPEGFSDEDGVGRFSPETDPQWWTSNMAPAPLRISRPPSVVDPDLSFNDAQEAAPPPQFRHRSSDGTKTFVSESGSTHALNYPDYLDQDDYDDAAPVVPRNRSQTSLNRRGSDSDTRSYTSFSYPGRLETGLRRTESGNETYYPGGVDPEAQDTDTRRNRRSGASGGSRKLSARDAGRAF